jgi:hypothetical protein
MAFELQPEQAASVEEPIVIYEPLRTHRDVPACIHAGLAGIEHLTVPEIYPPPSMVPGLGPELDYFGFDSGVAEFAGPSHSPCEVVPGPLNLHLGAGELDSHGGRKDTPTEPSPLSDPDVSRLQVLAGESMGSLLSGDSVTGSETHQE